MQLDLIISTLKSSRWQLTECPPLRLMRVMSLDTSGTSFVWNAFRPHNTKLNDSNEFFVSNLKKVPWHLGEVLTGRSRPLSQPPHTSWVFWCAGFGETADLPWPSCTDFSDAHSHDWLWNLAWRKKRSKESTLYPASLYDNVAKQSSDSRLTFPLYENSQDRNEMLENIELN